jgi:hypothetical protein
LSDFLLDLHQSLAHQELAKSLNISMGMPALFALGNSIDNLTGQVIAA